MCKILAIDLGKFKSVTCLLDTQTNETEFWTMSTDRPYKQALALDECEAILRKTAGKMYDPDLIAVFCDRHLGALYRDDYDDLPVDDVPRAVSSSD